MKGGKKGLWEKKVEKGKRGCNIFFPVIFRILGRISRIEEENQDFNNGGGEEYQVVENYIVYTPL